jgi:hypothetical protein
MRWLGGATTKFAMPTPENWKQNHTEEKQKNHPSEFKRGDTPSNENIEKCDEVGRAVDQADYGVDSLWKSIGEPIVGNKQEDNAYRG